MDDEKGGLGQDVCSFWDGAAGEDAAAFEGGEFYFPEVLGEGLRSAWEEGALGNYTLVPNL